MSDRLERLRRYLRLIRRHHRPLVYAFVVLARVRIGLSLGSYRSVQQWIERNTTGRETYDIPVHVAAWSVSNAARFVPGALCLAQALAVRYLLLRANRECVIRIGVKSGEDKPFGAHAWVLYGGECIIGGREENLQTFNRLVDL
ncbi:lasso peptide biosynthesis B2 protein [Qipengyuania spongiae]|uniref:Lasso peptide biosynthesis B2 protein n=1 Tax=Qipengyuania spongiae TaxID=2909673 RepID=A0ABY5SX20_9SPHN|nr:lasso peptide biosynthesis B2 protein [Qipengyuania spongiae]UVI39090.1 lasso peptide biosynthesis B2 protein [Qipengyuania spongiae]